jgi:uncharacterized protein (DUF983 family)
MAAAERSGNRYWRTYLVRVLARRCPRCGEGRLFATRFRLASSCEHCGLVYRREQGGMTGQMYLSAAVTEIVAAVLVLLVFYLTDWGTALSLGILLPVVLVFSYWFLPHSMALWVAVEYMTDIGNREHWVKGDERDGEG